MAAKQAQGQDEDRERQQHVREELLRERAEVAVQEQEFKRGDSVTWINKRKNAESGKVVTVKYEGGVPVSALIDIGGQRKKIQYNCILFIIDHFYYPISQTQS